MNFPLQWKKPANAEIPLKTGNLSVFAGYSQGKSALLTKTAFT